MSEESINEVLDLRIKEALSLGLRGYLVDTLLCLKEKRDEMIRNFDKDGYEEEEVDDANPFAVLERDREFSNVKGGIQVDLLRIDKCLLLHPVQVNYYELSKMELAKLQETMKTAVTKLKEEEGYFIRNCYNRCYFLLLASIENGRSFARKDKKLYNCRLIIQYRNYLHPKIDRVGTPFDIVYTIDKVVIPNNIKEFLEHHKMARFPYLRALDDYSKKFLRVQDASDKSDRRDSSKSQPRSSQKEPNARSSSPLDSSIKLPNHVLEFNMTPLPCSLLKFNNPQAEDSALLLNSLIITLMGVDKNTEEFCVRIIFFSTTFFFLLFWISL